MSSLDVADPSSASARQVAAVRLREPGGAVVVQAAALDVLGQSLATRWRPPERSTAAWIGAQQVTGEDEQGAAHAQVLHQRAGCHTARCRRRAKRHAVDARPRRQIDRRLVGGVQRDDAVGGLLDRLGAVLRGRAGGVSQPGPALGDVNLSHLRILPEAADNDGHSSRTPGHNGGVITLELARRLHDAGLAWDPAPATDSSSPTASMDDDVFVISEMVVESQEIPTGRVLKFNGTTEWALDSIDESEVIWLPREEQLRDMLGPNFVRLESALEEVGGFVAVIATGDGEERHADVDAERAYARALLSLLGVAS